MNKNTPERIEAVEIILEDCDDTSAINQLVRDRVEQMTGSDLQAHMSNHYGADSTDMLEGWDSIRNFVVSDMDDSAQSDQSYLKSVVQDYVSAMSDDEVTRIIKPNTPSL